MQKVHFSGKPLKAAAATFTPAPGTPCIYLLVDGEGKNPFYIGEYGKAETYDVIERIRRHFGGLSGTLARVTKNMSAFGFPVPSTFTAYVEVLPDEYRDPDLRKSLEAWVIHIACHQLKVQSNRFCVVKYQAPSSNESTLAGQIIQRFTACA